MLFIRKSNHLLTSFAQNADNKDLLTVKKVINRHQQETKKPGTCYQVPGSLSFFYFT